MMVIKIAFTNVFVLWQLLLGQIRSKRKAQKYTYMDFVSDWIKSYVQSYGENVSAITVHGHRQRKIIMNATHR